MKGFGVACLLSLFSFPGSVLGQDSVRLRYTPEFGTTVHRVFQTHTRMTTRAGGGASSDSRSRETVDLGEMVQVAAIGRGGEQVVHLRFDSLRTRVREGAGPWRESVWSGLDSLWVQASLHPSLDVARVNSRTQSAAGGLLLHLLTGVPNLSFPDQWLRSGDAWTTEHTVPLTGIVARGDRIQPVTDLKAHTVFSVDSIVLRPADTLAYLRFSGTFLPIRTAGGPVLSYGGGLAGTLVWSSGWNAFVSGAARFRVNVHLRSEAGTDGPGEAVVTLETTTRHRVRSGT